MNSGRRRKPDQDVKGHFTTVDKDGRVVWEPGLPSQVMSRRAPRQKPRNEKDDAEEAAVPCDPKVTMKLSPDGKVEWLQKALKGIPKGHVKAQDVYNIVTLPKFSSGLSERMGLRMLRYLEEARKHFSEKQVLVLLKTCELARRFRVRGQDSDSDSTDEEEYARRREKLEESHRSSHRPTEVVRYDEPRPPQPAAGSSIEPVLPSSRPQQEAGSQSSKVSAEERERLQKALQEKERQREEERKRVELERKAQMEREKQRKAKLGSAFLVGGDDEEEEKPLVPSSLPLMKGRDDRRTLDERASTDGSLRSPFSLGDLARVPRHSASGNPQMVEAMGGEKVLREVHAMLLQKVGPDGQTARASSRSRSRRRIPPAAASGSSDRHRPARMVDGSLRSPTPDGHKRGQMRAARKAKMIAACLGMGPPKQ